MTEMASKPLPAFTTHEVFNQPPPLRDYNVFTTDPILMAAVDREGAAWAKADLTMAGADYGKAETIEWGYLANQNPPKLQTFDRYGHRRDEVEFHPAYHNLMALGIRHGLHAAPWGDPKPGAHVARAAKVLMGVQAEAGVQCPITMTYGVVPALRRQPDLAAKIVPRICSRQYDPRFLPYEQKNGMTMGMGMTEKQGGSDLRTNTTRAEPIGAGGPSGEYRIVGHKWFFSAPMCDAFLILAYAPGGLSCFFLPRFRPDGSLNAIRIQRLKSKLGNHSNASSEVEFHGAYARLIGEEGRGVPNIIEMATYTRLDCALGSSALMRQCLVQAIHHAANRSAFQRRLIDQPLMSNVLADLALEVEAAFTLVMRLARAFDRETDEMETTFRRVMTPAVKFWICKRAPQMGLEALEVLGGAGYVEEGMMPRLYRELPLNSIWEGSGNVMCLDVLRALSREPKGFDIVAQELLRAKGADKRLDTYINATIKEFNTSDDIETRSRRLTERLALAMQASLLAQHAPSAVTDAFIASRLDRDWSGAFGTLPSGLRYRDIITRAWPMVA